MYQNRTAYIEELNNFINCSKNSFNNVLKTINWTKQSLISGKEGETLQNSDEDKPVADQGVLVMKEENLVEGLNNESGGGDHLYNDIVASLLAPEQPVIKSDQKDEDKAAALVQLLKMERDAKRRRISYKNKVHTKNKSHTEVLREVLEEQMLTITEGSGNDSAVANSDRLQPSSSQAQELIAICPPQGNPHLAWLDILEKGEGDRHQSDSQARTHKSERSSHNRHSDDQKERFRYDEVKERKKDRKDRKRKEEDHDKHRKRKEEDHDKHRDREKRKERDDMDRNYEDRHHKKKKKRSTSHSPRPDVSNHHRHKSKHKKKKH
ncbi:splicing regulatory glutamine/lysine-rich protein 1 [Halyomorpha halys]|uniref:splicing regulatory glutamine/lysine-rich protein 1 n=1 Tax=Halyomorpha halys TaxID=286706 RepID=UPI0006D50F5E|nr:splicing regulatory glutamine/lysine-rich protein 1-like [Halyomorpha halys]